MIFRVSPVVMSDGRSKEQSRFTYMVNKNGHMCPGEGYGLSSDCMTWGFCEECSS